MKIGRLCELVELMLNSEDSGSTWQVDGVEVAVAWEAVNEGVRDVPGTTEMIVSSLFGQLHTYAQPGAPPFVSVGQTIVAGQCVALLESMKSFCPVISGRAGRIVEIFVEHGAEVELGQPLFRVA